MNKRSILSVYFPFCSVPAFIPLERPRNAVGAEHSWFYARYVEYSKGCAGHLPACAHARHRQLRHPCSGLPTPVGRNAAHRATSAFSMPHCEALHNGFASVSKLCLRANSVREVSKNFISCTNLFQFLLFSSVLIRH